MLPNRPNPAPEPGRRGKHSYPAALKSSEQTVIAPFQPTKSTKSARTGPLRDLLTRLSPGNRALVTPIPVRLACGFGLQDKGHT